MKFNRLEGTELYNLINAVSDLGEGTVFYNVMFGPDGCITTMDHDEILDKINNKSNNKNKMNKKKTMELDKEIVKLDAESYNKMRDMFNSPDKENHAVAFSILENLEVKPNLIFMWLLYKFYKDISPDQWKKITPGMEKVLKSLGKGSLSNVTYINMWNTVRGIYSTEDLQEVVNEFANILKGHVTEWGFAFLKNCDWKITVRSDT